MDKIDSIEKTDLILFVEIGKSICIYKLSSLPLWIKDISVQILEGVSCLGLSDFSH